MVCPATSCRGLGRSKRGKNGMKIVIVRSPKLLAPLLGRLFGVKCKKGDNIAELEFDLRGLADGKYHLRFVAYSVGEMGGTTTHDVVHKAVCFEIENMSSSVNNILWEHAYWGSMCFPPIKQINEDDN